MPLILDGKKVRDEMQARLKALVGGTLKNGLMKPCLAIVQIGDNPESTSYIGQKIKFGEAIGVEVRHVKFPKTISPAEVIARIVELNNDLSVHGIIVQLPLPTSFGATDKDAIIETIDPRKDVDGLTAANVKKLWSNSQSGFIPATPRAVIALLDYYKIAIAGKHAVIVGRSELVGKPLALALLNRDATVTLCHSKTPDLTRFTKQADILIVAAGKARFITGEFAAQGQTVVDVGITVESGLEKKSGGGNSSSRTLVGDVDFDVVAAAIGDSGAISPVPGGVGPLTVACLFENLLQAYNFVI